MNTIEIKLNSLNPSLFESLDKTKQQVSALLGKYSVNFPTYTDHSIDHTLEVYNIASEIIPDGEFEILTADELYILAMACILHDIGMCIPEDKIQGIPGTKEFLEYKDSHPNLSVEDYLRDIHHQLSNKLIQEDWETLNIPSKKYAIAIGIVAEGHRKVDLGDFDVYDPGFFVKSGRESVCLPYLSCILRLADELEITNSRTPKLLTKYYMPNNETSIREWKKHLATSQRNYKNEQVVFEVTCSDQNIYAALQDQFDKIQKVINYCQKITRAIPIISGRKHEIEITGVDIIYNFFGFDPKGIKFSFDVENVVTAFIGEDLYKDKLTSLREAVQNSVDSCRYKSNVLKEVYTPSIKIFVRDNYIQIEDNGAGMDEFIIENFFGRLASSFYEQQKIKSQFEAIGQFGVGVFSYFLISEYIDIETKTINNKALKFRFDKDPKSYFHFYDKVERETPGTTITMYLKEELRVHLTDVNVEDYIRKVFRHIEINIEIISIDKNSIVEFKPFNLEGNKEINERLKIQHRKVSEQLSFLEDFVKSEEAEGYLMLIIGKEYLKIFSYDNEFFDNELFKVKGQQYSSKSEIAISQKGVFVNNYRTPFSKLTLGDINLKKKVKINIDRNEFTDEISLYKLLGFYELVLLQKAFELARPFYKNDVEKLQVSNDFLTNYAGFITSTYSTNNNYLNFLLENIKIQIFKGLNTEVVDLNYLYKDVKNFILVSDKEDYRIIYSHFKIPILIAQGYLYNGSYDNITQIMSRILDYKTHIKCIGKHAYLFYSKDVEDANLNEQRDKIQDIVGRYTFQFVNAESNKLCVSVWRNKNQFEREYTNDSIFINLRHWFIQFLLNNYTFIMTNTDSKRIIRAAFAIINESNFRYSNTKHTIDKLNEILHPFNNLALFKKLTLQDIR